MERFCFDLKTGKCGENCKYCAQSVHYKTNCEVYDFLDEEEILKSARENYKAGVDRFAIVTSGIGRAHV